MRDRTSNLTALQAALDLASAGYAVFPVSTNKRPRTPNGYLAASTDADRIREMASEFGFPCIGVATGDISDAVVLDVDQQHGGETWWRGNRHMLPVTRVHRTKNGGLHVWFRNRPGLRNVPLGKLGMGIEVRGQGGSCIWWPAAGLPVLCDAPLAPYPDMLIPAPRPATAPMREPNGPRPAEHIESSLMGIVRTIARAAPGSRNGTLFWGAARCAEMTAHGELSRRHAEAALIEAASRAGLDRQEATPTIASAFRTVVG